MVTMDRIKIENYTENSSFFKIDSIWTPTDTDASVPAVHQVVVVPQPTLPQMPTCPNL